jgi:hypothetical protein
MGEGFGCATAGGSVHRLTCERYSCFVPLMSRLIDTLGKASRHGMVVRVECDCGNLAYFRAADLAAQAGAGRDPRSLRFRCTCCKPRPVTVTVLELDRDRMPRIDVRQPHVVDGRTRWLSARLR